MREFKSAHLFAASDAATCGLVGRSPFLHVNDQANAEKRMLTQILDVIYEDDNISR